MAISAFLKKKARVRSRTLEKSATKVAFQLSPHNGHWVITNQTIMERDFLFFNTSFFALTSPSGSHFSLHHFYCTCVRSMSKFLKPQNIIICDSKTSSREQTLKKQNVYWLGFLSNSSC